jgi:hypothetical protein
MTLQPRSPFLNRATIVACAFLSTPSPAQTPAQPARAPAPTPLSITIRGPVTSELAPAIGSLVTTFYQVYPRLLDRFENQDRPAPRSITLVLQPGLRVPGMSGGHTVTVSREWLTHHPDDLGMLTHELTHLVQAYPNSEPGWLTEGIAELSRAAYTPVDRPDWKLPEHLGTGQNFDSGYTVSGRFLQWLDHKHPGTVDRLHHQMQAGAFRLSDFSEFTGKTAEQLWAECVADLAQSRS